MIFLNIQTFILVFFVLGCTGWVCESIQESIVRQKFVNKGFFKGPFVLSQAIGGVCVYALGCKFKESPILVFAAGVAVCTAVEYLAAIFVEKCFKVKCWDYASYPHTKWCHFQGRICLTISLFFGLITLFLVYVYMDIILNIAAKAGSAIWIIDGILAVLFLVDVIFSCIKIFKYKKAGIKIKSWAVFSDFADIDKMDVL
ncbi:MAG: putative ABC transporter permease [Termitinemataceae bacterium]|nr:MAG: putative ABC transporter permease [Termitinemataceae bacterium]